MNPWIIVVVVVLIIGVLVYWWSRPLSWRDGEGRESVIDESNSLMDTDVGSTRWMLFWGLSDETNIFFRLREWWQRERERWRKD